jgi:hypothetical protein
VASPTGTTRRSGVGHDRAVDLANVAVAQAARRSDPPEVIYRLKAERKHAIIKADIRFALTNEPFLTREQRADLARLLLLGEPEVA